VKLRGWDSNPQPTDPTVNHQVRAIEEAAWTIVWGVEEGLIQWMLRKHYAEQAAGYEIQTGSTSRRLAHWNDPTPVTAATPCHTRRSLKHRYQRQLVLNDRRRGARPGRLQHRVAHPRRGRDRPQGCRSSRAAARASMTAMPLDMPPAAPNTLWIAPRP
jgi:hypothetical protein